MEEEIENCDHESFQGQYLDSPHSSWFFRELYGQPKFAHHPVCDCYNNHLIRIGHHSLCLGCTCVGCGILLATASLSAGWLMETLPKNLSSWISAVGLGLLFFLPTLVQPFCQIKLFKIASRTSLGVSVVLLCYGGLLLLPLNKNGYLLRVFFVMCFFCTYKLTCWYRQKFTREPKTKCGIARYPFCSGNQVYLTRIYNRLIQRAEKSDPLVEFARNLITSGDGSFSIENPSPCTAPDEPFDDSPKNIDANCSR